VGVLCKRYIGVPKVAPKERLQVRQTQRCRPFLLPFLTTWVAPQRGHGGLSGQGFRVILSTSYPDYTMNHYSAGGLPTLLI